LVSEALVEYGSETRISPWRMARRAILGLALTTAVVVALRVAWHQAYYSDYDSLRRVLSSVPGATFMSVGAYEDNPWVLKVVEGQVAVGGDPTKVIVFRTSDGRDLRSGEHVRLCAIGPHRLWATDPDSSCPDFLDVGLAGPFGGLISPPVKNVDDLVARYDEVLSKLAALPADGTHRAADGRVYQFHRK
jgi:hypothetical protein